METQESKLFSSLERILQRIHLDCESAPASLGQWQEFIARINNSFNDFEQERYLLERSMEISSREMLELNEERAKLNQRLIEVSRQAGMSEIATSILHNIGNILNSVQTSVSLINEALQHSEIEDLAKISQMIQDNAGKADYLTQDGKGKLIPGFLSALSNNLALEQEQIKREVVNLAKCISHIKSIVAMQKDISGIAGVKEKVLLSEVCDLAVQMVLPPTEQYEIELIKKYDYTSFIWVDKSKLLQILVNLIKNAKDALKLTANNTRKCLMISIYKSSAPSMIEIRIKDNGVGVPQDHLHKIFSMGFTTKKEGHGFGLHSSAIAAKELKGSLQVESQGPNQGATFILQIPETVNETVSHL